MQTKDYYFNSFYGWWKNIDKLILIIVLTLLFLGLFFSLVSTSLIASNKLETNSYYFFIKHFVFVIAGLCFLFSFSILNQENLQSSKGKLCQKNFSKICLNMMVKRLM